MRNILNLFFRAGIIALASYWFPNQIECIDLKTLAMVIICMIIVGIVYEIISLVLFPLLAASGHLFMYFSIIIVTMLSFSFIQLIAADRLVHGFAIHGALTYVILVILFSIFQLSNRKKAG